MRPFLPLLVLLAGCTQPASSRAPAALTASPIGTETKRYETGEGADRYAFDLPKSYTATTGLGAGTIFRRPQGGTVTVVFARAGDPNVDSLIAEARQPTPIRPGPRRQIVLEPLSDGDATGYYRNLTMTSRARAVLHDVTATLADAKTLRHVSFSGRPGVPDPSREEILAILRSIRPIR